MWRNAAGAMDGWSFHFARDPNRTVITFAAPLNLTNDTRLELAFDLAALLNAPRPISFGKDGSSTHSRAGDPIAAAIAANLPGAFQVSQVSPFSPEEFARRNVKPLYLPEKFTPYPFQMSATFPIPALPRDNPLIVERVGLGEKLFHEPLLSKDHTLSCASCHNSQHAFADPRRVSVGVQARRGTRNAMPLFNLAWRNSFFWDGRAPTLRAQALIPIQDHTEMDETLTNVVAKLGGSRRGQAQTETRREGAAQQREIVAGKNPPANELSPRPVSSAEPPPDYPALFTAAFGTPEITPEKIGLALESFLLTLTSFDSKFDRALKGEATLTGEEQRGLELFMTEFDPRREQFGADCFHCHGGPLFQSQTFANNGLDAIFADPGRARVTRKESDQGKFATPTLRNIALTAPYMHDGRFQTLEEVIAHYASGGQRSATLDPNLAKHPAGGIRLSEADQQSLVAFLKTLTDEKYRK
jgi:cytochrome c peroxidase